MNLSKNISGNKNNNSSSKEIESFQEKTRNKIIKNSQETEKIFNKERNKIFVNRSKETIDRINNFLNIFENTKDGYKKNNNNETFNELLEPFREKTIKIIKNIFLLYQKNNLNMINSEEENHKNIYNEVLETYNNVLEKIQNS